MADTHSIAEKMRLSEPTTKILNEDRPMLLAAKMHVNDSSFWRYKVYADIHGDSLGRGVKHGGVVDNGNFPRFRLLFFGNFRDEASIIILQYAVRRQLLLIPKCITLNDVD